MLGDMDPNQINELKEEQMNERKPRAKKKSKNGGVEIQLESLRGKQAPAKTAPSTHTFCCARIKRGLRSATPSRMNPDATKATSAHQG